MTPFGEKLHEMFRYEDGEFYRLTRPSRSTKIGDIVGSYSAKGYIQTRVDGKQYYLHLLIWYYHYDKWPDGIIDHINRKKDDNRIENLRDVSMIDNRRNTQQFDNDDLYISQHKTSGRFGINIGLIGAKTYEEAKEKRDRAVFLLRNAGLIR